MKTMRKSRIVLGILAAVFFLVVVSAPVVFGVTQTNPSLDLQVPFGDVGKTPLTLVTIDNTAHTLTAKGMATYFGQLYAWSILAVSVVAVVVLMVGGGMYLTARGDSGQTEKARKIISNAIVGLVLTLGAYSFLFLINPALVQLPVLRLGNINDTAKLDIRDIVAAPALDENGNVSASGLVLRSGVRYAGDLKWKQLSTGMTADDINNQLKGTQLATSGSAILQAATRANIDPAFALAIWTHDSSLGTKGIASYTKNPGNITASAAQVAAGTGCYIGNNDGKRYAIASACPGGCAGNRAWRCYNTFQDAATDWFNYASGYTDPKLQLVNAFISRYAPSSENNTGLYIDQVCQYMIDMTKNAVQKAKVKAACGPKQ